MMLIRCVTLYEIFVVVISHCLLRKRERETLGGPIHRLFAVVVVYTDTNDVCFIKASLSLLEIRQDYDFSFKKNISQHYRNYLSPQNGQTQYKRNLV